MGITGTHNVGDTGHVTDHNTIDLAILALQALVPTAPILAATVTAKGDLFIATASGTVTRLAVGSNGQALVADSAQPGGIKWGSATDSGAIQKSTATAKGDLLIATASGTIVRLPVGSDGQFLSADSSQSTGVKWGSSVALSSTPPTDLGAVAVAGSGTTASPYNHVHSRNGITNVAVPRPESGAYVTTAHTNTSTGAGYLANIMYLTPVDLATGTAFNAIGTGITATGTGSGQVIRMGAYADDGTEARPTGVPLFDAGTIDSTSTTGDRTLAITQTLGPGRIWLAWALQGTVTTSPTMVVLNTVNQMGLTTLGNNSHRCWAQSGVSTALPTIGTLFRNPSPPMIALKVA